MVPLKKLCDLHVPSGTLPVAGAMIFAHCLFGISHSSFYEQCVWNVIDAIIVKNSIFNYQKLQKVSESAVQWGLKSVLELLMVFWFGQRNQIQHNVKNRNVGHVGTFVGEKENLATIFRQYVTLSVTFLKSG